MDAPVRTQESLDLFVNATKQFERALNWIDGIKAGIIEYLINPKRTIHVRFPVNMDDGSIRTFHGFRVLHNRVRGPGKGGIRYHPDVSLDEDWDAEPPKEIWRIKVGPGWSSFTVAGTRLYLSGSRLQRGGGESSSSWDTRCSTA